METELVNVRAPKPTPVPRSSPQEAAVLHAQGLARLQVGDIVAASGLLRQAVALNPGVATYYCNLAIALRGQGPAAERIALYRRAIELDPEDPVTRANLAAVLTDTGNYLAAEEQARLALQLAPERVETWLNLGGALAGQQRWEESAAAFESALRYQPDSLPALGSAAKAHHAAGHLPRAVECYREALQCKPDDLALLADLGNTLKAQARFDEAEVVYRRLVERAPHLPGAHVDMGTICQMLGRHEDAVTHFRAALALDPRSQAIYSNLGTSITYSASHGPADLKRVYDEFDRIVAKPLRDSRPHVNDRNPERPLRVGYVSPDFRKHAVAYFALPLLEGHSDQVEVVCYYNHRQDDEWTQRFKGLARQWVDCVAMNDATLAERIRADRIDILVDLAGHTLDNRLKVFARKPAPVQVTWMGYVTTTGLSAIDYRLTHVDADPPGVESDYAETLVHLPGTMWCFRPLEGMPEVSPPPFLRKGHVTFGAFNRFSKVSRRVLECWAKILSAVPDSHLILCIPEGAVRDAVVSLFAGQGVRPGRLTLFSKVSHEQFWSLHGEADIALDPFPFNGGTTTCETLWLGVPLITCSGGTKSFAPRFASRMGRTFLNAIGLPEFAATNEQAYIDNARTLANDRNRLAGLRQTLRGRMAASPLTDKARFVGEVEAAYRQVWRKWCTASLDPQSKG